MKKIITLSLLFCAIFFTKQAYSWLIPEFTVKEEKKAEKLAEKAAAALVKGGIGAVREELKDSNPVGHIAKAVVENKEKIAEAFMSPLQALGKKVRGELRETAADFGAGLKEATDQIGEDMQKTFDEDGKLAQGIGAAANTLNAKIINKLLHKNLFFGSGIIVTACGCYFVLKYAIPHMINNFYLPTLIIESSKKGIIQKVLSIFKSAEQETTKKTMEFSTALKTRCANIIKTTRIINQKIKAGYTNVKYRNIMLYGPPGTGKTMFAKELAKLSGLEFAMMSGSSFSKFKDGDGIQELDKLFAWAKKSKGLMIFIDEAETFLSKRENMDPQSKAYQLLNNFLNYTGERSSQFMLVFATNHHNALDSAMYRRIDDLIEMPLPAKAQRANTLKLYKDKILMDREQNEKSLVDSAHRVLTNSMISLIAERTKGLSYGDLEGIMNTIKTDTDILDPAVITIELVNTVVDRAMQKHATFTQGVARKAIQN